VEQLQLIVKINILLISLVLIAFIIGKILGCRKIIKTSLKCPNCAHIFKPRFLRFPIALLVGELYWFGFLKKPFRSIFSLECPKCKRRSQHSEYSVVKDTEIMREDKETHPQNGGPSLTVIIIILIAIVLMGLIMRGVLNQMLSTFRFLE